MNHVLSPWILGVTAITFLIVFAVIMEVRNEVDERHLRLLALTVGVPMTALLALEGVMSDWIAGGAIAGVVTFATRPWDRFR